MTGTDVNESSADRGVVVVTGAAGFLGSAIILALRRRHELTAIDIREPGDALREAAPEVSWERLDIAEPEAVTSAFEATKQRHGRIDVLVHFAAFYHFDTDWRTEYERTNVHGTAVLLQAAKSFGVERVVFASSIAAMEPPPAGERLTGQTPTSDVIPYARSKGLGENLIRRTQADLPGIVLRIGGAFSDWCELPPLYSLIKLWASKGPLNRIVPGRGESGIPYIHREDVAGIVERCVARHRNLAPFEVFLASAEGAVSHNELYAWIRRSAGRRASASPIHIPPRFAKLGTRLRLVLGRLTGERPVERPWMLDFVDRPWVADISHTRSVLDWSCSPDRRIAERIPVMVERFLADRRSWEKRNRQRNAARYVYSSS